MPINRIKFGPFWWQDLLWKALLVIATLLWGALQGFTLDFADPWRGVDMAVFVVLSYYFIQHSITLYIEIIEERGWYRPIYYVGIYIAYLALMYGLARIHIALALIPALPGCVIPPYACRIIRRRFRLFKGNAYRNVKPYGFVRRYYRQLMRKSK
ncbi:hypothetical protein [Adonisia turfae]|uniref:Uncharacterized protein n=1 Tax=Adonisia turfae CCMR0081 TaxID=2292702 RepID=A0A6M0RXY7_9CYAN|nr:hypothetical protein [Adonisia turfae]NEZ61044.1 hypothetical protein [Adonisia turfae CCMR0081]